MNNFENNFINIEKLTEVTKGRTVEQNDYSCVVKEWEGLENLKTNINELNNKIFKLSNGNYLKYEDNLHITAIGVEGFSDLGDKEKKEILELISTFPNIKIDTFDIEILTNGLIVCQIYFKEDEKYKLKEWRLKFKPYGFVYANEQFIHKMHSVIGMFDYQHPPTKEKINLINNTIKESIPEFNKINPMITNKNVYLYKYKYTSFIEAQKIPHPKK